MLNAWLYARVYDWRRLQNVAQISFSGENYKCEWVGVDTLEARIWMRKCKRRYSQWIAIQCACIQTIQFLFSQLIDWKCNDFNRAN